MRGGERCEPGGGRACGVVAARQAACTGNARLKAWGPRARVERTLNMYCMVVTLEVSKLSGWLKANARCRVEGRACDAGGERCEPGSGRARGGVVAARQAACTGKVRLKAWGPRARAERTSNMELMVVTLEMSKLSGWLNNDARCQVEGRACDGGGGEVRAARREGLGCGGGTTSGMHGECPTQGLWGPRARAERTWNM